MPPATTSNWFPGSLFSLGGEKRDPGNDVVTALLYAGYTGHTSAVLHDKQHVSGVQFL